MVMTTSEQFETDAGGAPATRRPPAGDAGPAAPRRGQRAAVLAAALSWLVLLVFPAASVPAVAPVPAAVLAAVATMILLLVYLRAVLVVVVREAPRPPVIELGVVAALAVVLPEAFGGDWLGPTVYLAALCALALPPRRAVPAVTGATVLALVTGIGGGASAAQLLAVTVLTPIAGVVVGTVVRQVALARELSLATTEAERLRMARDLHDVVKQQAFVAAMELGAARGRITGDQTAIGHVTAAAEAVAHVQRGLSGVIDELRPPAELAPALRLLVATWSRRTGVPVGLHIDAADGVPAEPLLRVAGEALTNVERHAAASHVTVTVHGAELSVRDDGVGFDAATSGHGLRGIRERVGACGGAVEVRSGPRGTTLRARCPR